MKLYVKKLESRNPNRWSLFTIDKAIKMYEEHIRACIKSPFFTKDRTIKSFNEYLKTEI